MQILQATKIPTQSQFDAFRFFNVQGTIANFGTYTVDEKDHSASVHYIGSSYPNWIGTDQKRSIAITGDQMTWTDPATPFGGTAVVTLKRAK